MKKYILFALLLLAACSQNVGPEIISAVQMEIMASISEDTRTAVIDGGTSIYWQPGDAIAVFRGSSRGFFSTNILYTMTASNYGFEGICLAKDLDKLAGMDVTTETASLFKISVAIMKKNSLIQ